jgi:4-aminobutyrate aminotransferase-like enzyme
MYNFKHVDYNPEWYKEVSDIYHSQITTGKLKVNSQLIAKKAYGYTSIGTFKDNPLVFTEGYGPFLKDVDENIYLDFGSGIYTANLGHAHPKVHEAITAESKKIVNCHDYITPVKLAYCEKLVGATNGVYKNIHFYDNGTTAVEVAIKAAREITGKQDIISCFSDHHGKTMASASVGRTSHMNNYYRAPNFFMVPRPNNYHPLWQKEDGSIDTDAYINFYELFIKESTSGEIAAFVLEPIQGWAGTIIPPDDFFPKLKQLMDKLDILLISDEIITGTGRTGKWLCMDHWDINADITLLGKGIGNGFPMSVMLAKEEYSSSIQSINPSTTFGGNPLACAAGLATLEIIEEQNIIENSKFIGDYLLEGLKNLKKRYPSIGDVRGKGCMLGIEFVKDHVTKEPDIEISQKFYQECLSRNFIPGIPVLNLIRMAPPLIIDEKICDRAINIMDDCLKTIKG